MRPSRPRYAYTWDVEVVLAYIDSLHPLQDLSLKDLTFKLVTLIALITGQRCQSIHFMSLDFMQHTSQKFRFVIEDLIKTSKPGSKLPVLILPKYDQNERRCAFRTMEHYLCVTEPLRKSNYVFVSYTKPHKAVHKETISRWIKTTLCSAGVDISTFKSHSTRAAATSSANRAMVPLETIMKAASWQNTETFRLFYNKPLQTEDEFALAILDNLRDNNSSR